MLVTEIKTILPITNDITMAVLPATTQSFSVMGLDQPKLSKSRGKYAYEKNALPFVMRTGFGAPNYVPRHAVEQPHYTFLNNSYALAQLLSVENQFYVDTSSLLFVDAMAEDKVDASMRDEALTRLHSLHRAYYDLSPLTFCKAVCLSDTFITRVKVKPKYMMCVAAACYYIASKFETLKQPRPTVDSLVRLTRCGGSSSDLVRMVDIILTKLGPSTVTSIGAGSATTLDFLQIFLNDEHAESQDFTSLPTFLVRQLELALCTTNSAFFRPSCLALAIISAYKHNPIEADESLDPNSFVYQSLQLLRLSDLFNLANFCKMSWVDVDMCARTLCDSGIINSYSVSPMKSSPFSSSPPIVWNLSRRTKLSISGAAQPSLKTIDEWIEE